MYEYTYRNHLKFGYNQVNNYQPRESKTDKYTFEYGQVSQADLNWRQANELAARQIYENRHQDVTVLLSGGMDSEICFRSFYDQQLPVRTASLRFLDLDQSEEMNYIQKTIQKHNIKNHEFVDVEVKSFVKSDDFYKTADLSKCVSPIIVLHLWLANQVQGTPVIAQGEVHLHKVIPAGYVPGVSPYEPSDWLISEKERRCTMYMNFILQNKPAIPGFFQYNVEQVYSYLTQNKMLTELVNNKLIGKLGTRSSKNKIAHQFYPDVELREKRHGWESILDFHDEIRSMLAKRFPHSNDENYILIEDFLRMISSKKK